MSKNWIQGVDKEMKREGTVGAFTKQAKRAGMSVHDFAMKVTKHPQDFSEKTRRRANLALTFEKMADKKKMAHGGKVHKQGYDSQLDESLATRLAPEKKYKQSMKDRRDESKAGNKRLGRRAYSSVRAMDKGDRMMKHGGKVHKQGYADEQDESLGMRTGAERTKSQSMMARREDSYGKWGKRDEEHRGIKLAKGGSTKDLVDDIFPKGLGKGKEFKLVRSYLIGEDFQGKWSPQKYKEYPMSDSFFIVKNTKKRRDELEDEGSEKFLFVSNDGTRGGRVYGGYDSKEEFLEDFDYDSLNKVWYAKDGKITFAKGGTLSSKAVKKGYIRRDRYDKLKKDLKKQEIDCADDIKTMKKDIGKKVAKSVAEERKYHNTEFDSLEAERDKLEIEVDGLEKELGKGLYIKTDKKEKEQSFLLAGIAGILMGAFFGKR